MNYQISPLRYPGGKARIADFMEDLILLNNLDRVRLIELFAGGAGASLTLLENGIVEEVVLNDLDPHIFAFWKVVLEYKDELINLIHTTEINMDNWKIQKEIYLNYQHYDTLEIGFSTFFLNRTNRSGILNAGPIGGLNQEGNYKMDVRYNVPALINRIERIASLRDKITIYNHEAIELIEKLFLEANDSNLFFLDPPYYNQGRNLYFNFYTHENHENLAYLLAKYRSDKWFLTYDNCVEINELYDSFSRGYLPMTYTLQEKVRTNEVIIFSDSLEIPKNIRFGRQHKKMVQIK